MGDTIDFASWDTSWEGDNACSIFLRGSKKKKSVNVKNEDFENAPPQELHSPNERKVKPEEYYFNEDKVDMKGIYNFSMDCDEYFGFQETSSDYNHTNASNVKKDEKVFTDGQNNSYENNSNVIFDNNGNTEPIDFSNNTIKFESNKNDNRGMKTRTDQLSPVRGSHTIKEEDDFSNDHNTKIKVYDLTKLPDTNYNIDEPIEVFDFTSSRGYFQSIKEEEKAEDREKEDLPATVEVKKEAKYHNYFSAGNDDDDNNDEEEEEKFSSTDKFHNISLNEDFVKEELSDGSTAGDSNIVEDIPENIGEASNETDDDISGDNNSSDDNDDDDDVDYVPDDVIDKEDDCTESDDSKIGVRVTRGSKKKKKKSRVKLKLPKDVLRRSGRIVDEKLRCKTCGYQAKAPYILTAHLRKHTGEKPFECAICKKKFSMRGSYNEHILMHTGEKPHKCQYCDNKFRRRAQLNEHIRVHTGEMPYKCDVCDRLFKQRSSLGTHLLTHTNIKPFKCHICKKRFRQKITMQNHVRMHTGEKPYKCEHCDMRFSRTDGLLVHNRIHTNELPYQCKVCLMKFRTSSCLKRHLTTHSDVKAFKCTYCPSEFKRKDQLDDHNKCHTGVRPYTCDICNKTFARRFGMIIHKRIHTGEKPYPCLYCEYRFNASSGLKRHMRRQHKDKLNVKKTPEESSKKVKTERKDS